MTGFTPFQAYKIEIWAENALGRGKGQESETTFFMTNQAIESFVKTFILMTSRMYTNSANYIPKKKIE